MVEVNDLLSPVITNQFLRLSLVLIAFIPYDLQTYTSFYLLYIESYRILWEIVGGRQVLAQVATFVIVVHDYY